MSKSAALSIHNAWNSVALEERLDLVSKCQADGLMAALTFTFMMGAVAYGFDKIILLAGAAVGASLIMPMFSSYSWRRGKPALILQYLAARSVARRYAYGSNISDFDIVIIFRGEMSQDFLNSEDKLRHMNAADVEFGAAINDQIPVWICLLRGGVVLLSERDGGAKLEYVSPIGRDMTCQPDLDEDGQATGATKIVGIGPAKGRQIVLSSRFDGAMYVFQQQLKRLIYEAPPPMTAINLEF